MEVVEKEPGVHHIHCVVRVGEGPCISNVNPNPRTERGRQTLVEMGSGMAYGDRIGVNPDQFDAAAKPLSTSQEMDEVVASSTPHIQYAKAVVPPKQRVKDRVGC